MEHPAYDAFWQGQVLDKLVADRPSQVPTMWIQGLWDQEDMWGAIHCYLALKARGQADHNYLVMGPWRHSQVNYDGFNLGPFKWDGDTAYQFRRDVLRPFFDRYLKDSAPKADTPPVFIYNTGENHWDRLKNWPLACAQGCAAPMKPLYFEGQFGLGFDKPSDSGASDAYVSDPSKPIPYIPRPNAFRRHGALEALAGNRSTRICRSSRRAGVSSPRANRTRAREWRAHRRFLCRHHRNGRRLGGEADRCFSG